MTIQQERDIALAALERIADNDSADHSQWRIARDAFDEIAAIAAQASPVAQDDLPPLPEKQYLGGDEAYGDRVWGFTVEQMEAYAIAARASVAVPAALEQMLQHELDRAYASIRAKNEYIEKIEPSMPAAQPVGEAVAAAIHYPEHWDTAAYPAVEDALSAVYHNFQCTECSPPVTRTTLVPMGDDAGAQWYFDCNGYYIDVEKDGAGKYSVYFRDRATGGETWLDQADVAPPVAQDQDAARYRWLREKDLSAVEYFWSDARLICDINDSDIDAAMQAEGK